MDQRKTPSRPTADQVGLVDEADPERPWTPPFDRDEERELRVHRDVRPLVERCRRLRDRGLLD